jgi:hypothetical protein
MNKHKFTYGDLVCLRNSKKRGEVISLGNIISGKRLFYKIRIIGTYTVERVYEWNLFSPLQEMLKTMLKDK